MAASLDQLSDEELLNQYFIGESSAFECFVKRHLGRVIAYARAKGLRDETARDVAQDAFFKLHRFIHKYEKGRPALPWFFSIVHHCIIDRYREEKRTHFVQEDIFSEQIADPRSMVQTDNFKENFFEYEKAFSELSKDQQFVFKKRVFEELSFKEIASMTGKSESALRKIFERSKILLKEILGK